MNITYLCYVYADLKKRMVDYLLDLYTRILLTLLILKLEDL